MDFLSVPRLKFIPPLILADLYDAYQVDGAAGALKTLPSVVSVVVQTHESKKRPSDR